MKPSNMGVILDDEQNAYLEDFCNRNPLNCRKEINKVRFAEEKKQSQIKKGTYIDPAKLVHVKIKEVNSVRPDIIYIEDVDDDMFAELE